MPTAVEILYRRSELAAALEVARRREAEAEFVRQACETPYIHGIPVDAICQHLQAVPEDRLATTPAYEPERAWQGVRVSRRSVVPRGAARALPRRPRTRRTCGDKKHRRGALSHLRADAPGTEGNVGGETGRKRGRQNPARGEVCPSYAARGLRRRPSAATRRHCGARERRRGAFTFLARRRARRRRQRRRGRGGPDRAECAAPSSPRSAPRPRRVRRTPVHVARWARAAPLVVLAGARAGESPGPLYDKPTFGQLGGCW